MIPTNKCLHFFLHVNIMDDKSSPIPLIVSKAYKNRAQNVIAPLGTENAIVQSQTLPVVKSEPVRPVPVKEEIKNNVNNAVPFVDLSPSSVVASTSNHVTDREYDIDEFLKRAELKKKKRKKKKKRLTGINMSWLIGLGGVAMIALLMGGNSSSAPPNPAWGKF